MKTALLVLLVVGMAAVPASAASVSRSYSYFSIGGKTLEDIERQLETEGPHVNSTGKRHPGATRLEFTTRLGYGETGDRCRVAEAQVAVKADVVLPRWRDRARADRKVALIWDTLARDIERHEESHLVIARTHARELERALKRLSPMRSCEELAERVEATTDRILAKHDAAQERFDRVEGINFEDRFMRLLRYRLERESPQGPRRRPGDIR